MNLQFDPHRVRRNAHEADSEDLLDRITIYRDGMEAAAIEIIEAELAERGVTQEQIDDHERRRCSEVLLHPDGLAAKCSFCRQPATQQGWGWHRLWGWVPVFPRVLYYCREHRPW